MALADLRTALVPRRTAGWGLAALALAFVLVSCRWIWLYRHGQPADIDESGYLGLSIADYHALLAGGPFGWLAMVEAPSIQAPLTTAAASLVYLVTGPHAVAGFVVPLAAALVAVLASYGIARQLVPPAPALAAAALVASCPMVLQYARSFHFAMPSAAVMTVALLCLLRSDRLFRLGPACLFGLCLGLLPLARTVTIAFVPGLVLAALLYAAAAGGYRPLRLARFALAMLVALAAAASWLAFSGGMVFGYLFNFGYGSRASEFASGQTGLIRGWPTTLRTVAQGMYLPHTLVLLAGVVALAVLLVRRARAAGAGGLIRSMWRSPAMPLVVSLGAALEALTTSPNKGSAFMAPLLPVMLVLAVWAVWRACAGFVGHSGTVRRVLAAGAALACVVAAVPLLDGAWGLARPRVVAVPLLGPLAVTNGQGTIQQYEVGAGFDPAAALPVSRTDGRAWVALSQRTAGTLLATDADKTPVAFGFRHYLFNVNTVNLQMLLAGTNLLGLIQVEPVVTGDTPAGYAAWLSPGGAAAAACTLLTLSGQGQEFLPPVTRPAMDQAAHATGFGPVGQWAAPNGRQVTQWRRACPRA